jgi:hypothetical protein
LKKRTKKLLVFNARAEGESATADKSFFASFFSKKEESCFSRRAVEPPSPGSQAGFPRLALVALPATSADADFDQNLDLDPQSHHYRQRDSDMG